MRLTDDRQPHDGSDPDCARSLIRRTFRARSGRIRKGAVADSTRSAPKAAEAIKIKERNAVPQK